MKLDAHSLAMMRVTATKLQHLAALRGITCTVEVNEKGNYEANGHDCGCSVHGFNEWLNKQPGVKP